MSLQPETFKTLVRVAAEQVIASAPELTSLDQAIGDGDHGTNMKRGFEAVLSKLDAISSQPFDEALKTIGKTLVMTVGGASGPLYGSFFLAAGEALSHSRQLPDDLAEVFGSGVSAVSARGRSQAGEKTMLDVLIPVLETLKVGVGQPDLIERRQLGRTGDDPFRGHLNQRLECLGLQRHRMILSESWQGYVVPRHQNKADG